MPKKTQQPVQFEITEQTREAVAAWIAAAHLKSDQYLFPSRVSASPHLSTRQYARIVGAWAAAILWRLGEVTESRSEAITPIAQLTMGPSIGAPWHQAPNTSRSFSCRRNEDLSFMFCGVQTDTGNRSSLTSEF